MAKYEGWIDITLRYDVDAGSIVDAENQMRSAVNKIKNLEPKLVGLPEVLDWGVFSAENEES